MRRANPASCLVLRGGGTALPVGRGSAAAAALGRLSLLLRHLAQLLWRQPPPTAPGVPRIAGVRALVAEGAMSEARPEKHDGRRHDSQDGIVLPNLSRFIRSQWSRSGLSECNHLVCRGHHLMSVDVRAVTIQPACVYSWAKNKD